jgi:predicted amidohydrolase
VPNLSSTLTTVRIAACQLHITGEYTQAFNSIDTALAQAAFHNADIAVFPETTLYGWLNPAAHQLADPIPGQTTQRLAQLARKHKLMIAIGLAEREGNLLYDSAVLLDSNGELLLRHRKINILTELMEPAYSPGNNAKDSVVTTRFGRIGMLICADTFPDEIVAEIAANHPDLVLVPYGWAAPLKDWPEHGNSLHSWVAHTARRVDAPFVGVDATGTIEHGPWTGFLFGGQSLACDANGEIIGILADREAEVRVFEVELNRPNP